VCKILVMKIQDPERPEVVSYHVTFNQKLLSKVHYNTVSAYILSMSGTSGNPTPNPGTVNAMRYLNNVF